MEARIAQNRQPISLSSFFISSFSLCPLLQCPFAVLCSTQAGEQYSLLLRMMPGNGTLPLVVLHSAVKRRSRYGCWRSICQPWKWDSPGQGLLLLGVLPGLQCPASVGDPGTSSRHLKTCAKWNPAHGCNPAIDTHFLNNGPALQGNGKIRPNLFSSPSFLSPSGNLCFWASWLMGACGISPLHGVWSGAGDHEEIKTFKNPLSACILLSYTRWSPATTVRIGNALFSPCLKWTKYLARFKTEGAEWKELKAKSVGCQRHSVLLQILPGNRDGLHFSRRHWLKSAWDKGLGTYWSCQNKPWKSSHTCVWLPSSAVRFSSVEPSRRRALEVLK